MPNFCLMPAAVDNFKAKLADGTIDPMKLTQMTSEERHKLFGDIVGTGAAKDVNALFESKMLLKNQQRGMITWAKKVAGLTPEVRRDLITRIEKLDRVLDPKDQEQFLNDLAATKLGVGVTEKEAKEIADMSRKVTDAKSKQLPDGTFKNEQQRMNYGYAKVDLGGYVSDLRHTAEKLSLQDYVTRPGKVLSNAAGLTKSLKASLDDSAIFRQGWRTIFTNPKEWQANARKTFTDFARTVKGDDIAREVTADIVSRPNYDLYQKARLATATIEEAFPSQLPEKIPGLGRLFKASENAYTGFLHRQRADIFDKYVDIAKKSGVNLKDPKELQSLGHLVNSLTGRGNLGGFEKSANAVNNLFFSPRSLKATVDTLTAHLGQGESSFVKKQAAKNLVKVVVGTASVLAIADAIKPGSVEKDPRSSDFGKIKVGNTRFDVSGGMSSVVTLALRLLPTPGKEGFGQYSKSTSTGELKKLGGGYGSDDGVDVLTKFFENKLSPAASIVKDVFIKHQDFNGNKPTVMGELNNAVTPLPITTYQELKNDPNAANSLIGLLADGLGIATNTYGKSDVKWENSTTKELTQFKEKLGKDKFKEANKLYNETYDNWLNGKQELTGTKSPQGVSKSELPNLIKQAKSDIQDYVFNRYGYKYEKSQAEKDAAKAKAAETRARKKARGY